MTFSQLPVQPQDSLDEESTGMMHIGGRRRSGWRKFTLWTLLYAAVAAFLVGLFLRFGANACWAVALVGFMLGYMALMSRWAGDDRR